MNTLEKKENYAVLLQLYGNLLSETILERMKAFYLEDYSITEISEMYAVSRNAIFESISIGEKKLDGYEKKLKLKKKNEKALGIIDALEKNESNEEQKKQIKLLKGVIENGI